MNFPFTPLNWLVAANDGEKCGVLYNMMRLFCIFIHFILHSCNLTESDFQIQSEENYGLLPAETSSGQKSCVFYLYCFFAFVCDYILIDLGVYYFYTSHLFQAFVLALVVFNLQIFVVSFCIILREESDYNIQSEKYSRIKRKSSKNRKKYKKERDDEVREKGTLAVLRDLRHQIERIEKNSKKHHQKYMNLKYKIQSDNDDEPVQFNESDFFYRVYGENAMFMYEQYLRIHYDVDTVQNIVESDIGSFRIQSAIDVPMITSFAILICQLRNSNKQQCALAITQFLFVLCNRYKIDYETVVQRFFQIDSLDMYKIQGTLSDDFISSMKTALKTLRYRNSEFCTHLTKCIILICSYIVAKNIPGAKFCNNFCDFMSTRILKSVSTGDLLENIFETAQLVCEKATMAFTAGDMWLFFADESKVTQYEDACSVVMSEILFVESGQIDKMSMTVSLYKAQLMEMIKQTKDLISNGDRTMRSYYSARLIKLRDIERRLKSCASNAMMREAPYSVLISGGTSVGKTATTHKIVKYLLESTGVPARGEHVVTLNDKDKYQSEYNDTHRAVILDDICNTNPKIVTEDPLNLILKMINNAPMAVVKAEAELKGKIFWHPELVVATTNVEDLHSTTYSCEPASIMRRWQFVIEQRVKHEWSCSGGMLDSQKVREAKATNINEYVLKKYFPIPQQGRKKASLGFETVAEFDDDEQLLWFLKFDAKKFWETQKNIVRQSNSQMNEPLCEHDMLKSVCQRCLNNNAQQYDVQSFSFAQNLGYVFFIADISTMNLISFLCALQEFFMKNCSPFICNIFENSFFRKLYIYSSGLFTYMFFRIFPRLLMCWMGCVKYCNISKKIMENKKKILLTALGITSGCILTVLLLKKLRYLIQGSEEKTPCAKPDEKVNVWASCKRETHIPQVNTTGMTHQQLIGKLSRRVANITVLTETEKVSTNAFPLCSTFWLVPNHLLTNKEKFFETTLVFNTPDKNYASIKCILGPDDIQRCPEKDFAIINIRSAGPNYMFLDKISINTSYGMRGSVVGRTKTGELCVQSFHNEGSGTERVGGHTINVGVSSLSDGHFDGLCMAPYVADGVKPYIAGFHVAGHRIDKKKSLFNTISRDEISQNLELLKNKTVGFTASDGTAQLAKYDVEALNLVDIHKKSPCLFLSENPIMLNYGNHGGRRTFHTNVVKNPISDAIVNELDLPVSHQKPHQMNSYMHWRNDLETMSHVKSLFNPVSLSCAYRDFLETVMSGIEQPRFEEICPLPNDNVLCGADGIYGIDAINLNTSVGWPLNKSKRHFVSDSERTSESITCLKDLDERFWIEMERMSECMIKGERVYAIHRANLKDEPVSIGKTKVRVFAGCELSFLLLARKYLLPINKLIQENSRLFECAVGINATGPEWHDFVCHVQRFGEDRCVAGDFKAYDKNISPEITLRGMEILIKIAERAGYTQDQLKIVRGIATEICFPLYEYNGEFIQVFGSNPSGHPLTVILNNLSNSLYMRYAFYENLLKCEDFDPDVRFNQCVSLMCYGDDNIMTVSSECNWFDHTKISESLAEVGITYTMADKKSESVPFVDFSQMEFLKRKTRFDPDTGLYVSLLLEKSISKSLHYFVRSKVLSIDEQTAETIRCALAAYFPYGREIYERRSEQLSNVARDNNLSHLLWDDFVSYNTRLLKHRAKYGISWVPTESECSH